MRISPATIEKHPELLHGEAFAIALPLPGKMLCSNKPPLTPGARMLRAQLAKKYRAQAAKACRQFNCPEDGPPNLARASAKLYFFFKEKRRRDLRNFEAGMKAAYDGLVDGGLIIDDNSEVLTHETTVFDIDPIAPRVEIIITNLEAAA